MLLRVVVCPPADVFFECLSLLLARLPERIVPRAGTVRCDVTAHPVRAGIARRVCLQVGDDQRVRRGDRDSVRRHDTTPRPAEEALPDSFELVRRRRSLVTDSTIDVVKMA
jgi:hypothetical protein